MRKTVLITGASGSVGIEVMKHLQEHPAGYKIKSFDQDTRGIRKMLKSFKKVEQIFGDIGDREQLDRACQNTDFVIHLAAVIPPLADERPKLAKRVNIDATQNLVDALKLSNPRAFILYASSISVYGDRTQDPWIEVGHPMKPSQGDYYAETKIKAEEIIKQSGLSWSIFRLTAVMGVQTKMSPLFFHMPLCTSLEIITARDAGQAFAKAIEHQDALNGSIFNLSGGPTCRTDYETFLNRVFQIMGLKKLDFPSQAFASRNFHCGFYKDQNQLEHLLQFQTDALDDYYQLLEQQQPPLRQAIISLFHRPIKKTLLKKSDPFRAYQKGEGLLFRRFFRLSP